MIATVATTKCCAGFCFVLAVTVSSVFWLFTFVFHERMPATSCNSRKCCPEEGKCASDNFTDETLNRLDID